MKTTYRIPAPYAQQFLKLADNYICDSPARPERFIEKMKRNRGAVSAIAQNGLDENRSKFAVYGIDVAVYSLHNLSITHNLSLKGERT